MNTRRRIHEGIAGNVALPLLGLEHFKRLLAWWPRQPRALQRAWLAASIAFGAFLLWSALMYLPPEIASIHQHNVSRFIYDRDMGGRPGAERSAARHALNITRRSR